jgi:dephospho-CoA kinase
MTPFHLGLTGSIGMGKSTTAGFFADHGLPVWDADAAVARLYGPGGAATAALGAEFPEAVTPTGINRAALKSRIAADPSTLARLETLIHPLVTADRTAFLAEAANDILVFDIPLLFEKGTETRMDATLLVTAPPALQRARVLARPGMTAQQFETLLARQMPDAQKRSLATHIVETLSFEATRAYVAALIAHIRTRHA